MDLEDFIVLNNLLPLGSLVFVMFCVKRYGMLGIEFDSYAGESFYSDKMPSVLQELKDKGLMHESRGAQIVDLEDYGMPPAVITKSDGSSLYATRVSPKAPSVLP